MRVYFKFIILPLFLLSFLFISLRVVYAEENNELPAITVINPIRGNELGHEKDDLLLGLKYQWKLTQDAKIDATWLWQYSALEDEKMVNFAKNNMKNQEFGVFLEIDRNFARKAHVQYRGQGPWYFSDGMLLVSYDRNERERLIDEVFAKFKKTFGYYPKTVGAWWIGADSLVYMQKTYGIVAAMKASDQFDLDVYSIWGTPWGIPYVASSKNEGIPTNSINNSSDVVVLQWAPRDPTRGYDDFAYSVQDFTLRDDNFSYVNYLSSVFLHKPLDNMVIGLENSGSTAPLEIYYAKIVNKARELADKHQARLVLAKDYAQEFLATSKPFADSDTKFSLAKDYKSEDQSFWYTSVNYRAGIFKKNDSVCLVDLRDYSSEKSEDFTQLNNSQGYLRINMPAIIDAIRFPEQKIFLIKSPAPLRINQLDGKVTLLSGSKKIADFTDGSVSIFPDKSGTRIFNFKNIPIDINMVEIIIIIYGFYFVLLCLLKKDILKAAASSWPLIIIFFVAYSFLLGGLNSDFIFDRKELLVLSILPSMSFLSIQNLLLIFKIVPFIVLLSAHFIWVKFNSLRTTSTFFILWSLFLIYYAHTIYFPLDKSSYPFIITTFLLLFASMILTLIILFKKISKKKLVLLIISIPFVLGVFSGVIYLSRTKIILSQFEIDALTTIKKLHKDVIFVSETDFNVKPIYKAVKPLLYENYHLGEKLTNSKWQVIIRPENNILKVANYSNKLIVVPRYLGADLSPKEMQLLNLKKIFDNAQIAIFEKR